MLSGAFWHRTLNAAGMNIALSGCEYSCYLLFSFFLLDRQLPMCRWQNSHGPALQPSCCAQRSFPLSSKAKIVWTTCPWTWPAMPQWRLQRSRSVRSSEAPPCTALWTTLAWAFRTPWPIHWTSTPMAPSAFATTSCLFWRRTARLLWTSERRQCKVKQLFADLLHNIQVLTMIFTLYDLKWNVNTEVLTVCSNCKTCPRRVGLWTLPQPPVRITMLVHRRLSVKCLRARPLGCFRPASATPGSWKSNEPRILYAACYEYMHFVRSLETIGTMVSHKCNLPILCVC